jgi:hypothetical protein
MAMLLLQATGAVGQPDPKVSFTSDLRWHSDRPMDLYWQAKGWNQITRLDVRMESEWYVLQVNPTWMTQENRRFNTIDEIELSHTQRNAYGDFYRRFDLPETYGESMVNRLRWGDTNMMLGTKRIRVGMSTAARAWGSGVRQQLVLGGQAPGFAHAAIELNRVPIGVGTLSMELVGGRLDSSGYSRFPMPDEWRWLAGVEIAYSPVFLPWMEVGLTRVFTQNGSQLKRWSDYIPLLQPFEKRLLGDGIDGSGSQPDNQIASIFLSLYLDRLVVYGEYGRDDHSVDVRDLVLEPEHMRAYLIGVRFDDGRQSGGVEIVNTSESKTSQFRSSNSWYGNNFVRHGHTHEGRILGADIGPGALSREAWFMNDKWFASLMWTHHAVDLFHSDYRTRESRSEYSVKVDLRRRLEFERVSLITGFGLFHTQNRFHIKNRNETDWSGQLTVIYRFQRFL